MITAMTTTRERRPTGTAVDLDRWPAMRPPRPARVRAAAARAVRARVARRTGVTVTLPDGTRLGPADGPLLAVRNPQAFFARLGRDGNVGFGEAYMAGDWDAPDLVGVLEPIARNVASLIPQQLQ